MAASGRRGPFQKDACPGGSGLSGRCEQGQVWLGRGASGFRAGRVLRGQVGAPWEALRTAGHRPPAGPSPGQPRSCWAQGTGSSLLRQCPAAEEASAGWAAVTLCPRRRGSGHRGREERHQRAVHGGPVSSASLGGGARGEKGLERLGSSLRTLGDGGVRISKDRHPVWPRQQRGVAPGRGAAGPRSLCARGGPRWDARGWQGAQQGLGGSRAPSQTQRPTLPLQAGRSPAPTPGPFWRPSPCVPGENIPWL